MGQIALKLLLDRIRRPQQAVQGGILLPTTLMVRGSVRRLGESESEGSHRRQGGLR